jgi:hypothetical protein
MTIVPLVIALLAGFTTAPPSDQWNVDLSQPISSSDMSTVGNPETRISVYPPHTLNRPANTFSASAPVDLRGLGPDGRWTEWAETPAVLPVAAREVQVRVVYTGAPPPALTVYPSTTAAAAPARADAGTYEVFATREGLVGGTTASGHVIVARDHFAALPSRRGLSTKDSGDYSVRVCAKNGRCEWAPVWDVGPWNTKDDYWNPAGVRQMWADLPQGRPQAQAAKQDGYHGGLDQFGRVVRNPAGIDLADGAFWDGLQLTTNAWVTVTYQWTGSAPAGMVRSGNVDVRSAPRPDAPVVGLAANLAQVRIECQQGDWYRLAPDKWLPAATVSGLTGGPAC